MTLKITVVIYIREQLLCEETEESWELLCSQGVQKTQACLQKYIMTWLPLCVVISKRRKVQELSDIDLRNRHLRHVGSIHGRFRM